MSGDLVLGVDGGGSKTLVALADRTGRVVEMLRGGGINPLDNHDWKAVLIAQLRPLAADRGVAAVGAALPAYGEVETISAAQREVIAALFRDLPQHVLNDVDAAHLGAFAGGPGILILSGTGSMAWARDAAGKSYRTGGWGDVIGDEGSSHWIGRRILGRVSQAVDGRAPPTGLVAAICTRLRLDPNDVVNGLEGWVAHFDSPRAEIAALAPLATEFAAQGDAGAMEIITEAATELARHITAIMRKTGLPPDWSYAGGSFHSAALREAVAKQIGRAPLPPRLPPNGGALLAAAQLLDWPTDADWTARLAASLQTTPAKTPQPVSAN